MRSHTSHCLYSVGERVGMSVVKDAPSVCGIVSPSVKVLTVCLLSVQVFFRVRLCSLTRESLCHHSWWLVVFSHGNVAACQTQFFPFLAVKHSVSISAQARVTHKTFHSLLYYVRMCEYVPACAHTYICVPQTQ